MERTKKIALASIYFDLPRPSKNGECLIRLRITFNRKQKYYSTGEKALPDEFDKIMNAKRRTVEQKNKYDIILNHLNKANEIIKNLPLFTFDDFEDAFLDSRDITLSVSFAFDKYIRELKDEKRIGTAVSYETARNSLEDFKKNLTFTDISPKFLKRYEAWMLDNGKSISTVGIYLRSLRTIYNRQKIDKSIYPFGIGKYEIPASKNIKKALTIEEIIRLYQYEAVPGSQEEKARDYWFFLYLSNGMNVKDFCLLKRKNIKENTLKYERAKTQRTKKEQRLIEVAIKPETWEIINRWGQVSISKEAYIFPHLEPGLTATRQREIYQQLTKNINKYMKRIARNVGIDKDVTTYFARHSFATVLKRSGANISMISELLGHSDVSVTENYLSGFETEQLQKATDVLTAGLHRKAN